MSDKLELGERKRAKSTMYGDQQLKGLKPDKAVASGARMFKLVIGVIVVLVVVALYSRW